MPPALEVWHLSHGKSLLLFLNGDINHFHVMPLHPSLVPFSPRYTVYDSLINLLSHSLKRIPSFLGIFFFLFFCAASPISR